MNKEFSKEREGTGTYEWADINSNIQLGCSNGCLYCYARENALRYKRIATPDEWLIEKINPAALVKKWPASGKVIMFPTTHDITPANIDHCLKALVNMLTPGNKVLIVSKPHLSCVERMCEDLKPWKDQILFRFTIGCLEEILASFWEPGAPSPFERIQALTYAYNQGFQTSVSMEPMLGGWSTAYETYLAVEPFVSETIWIGKMNKIDKRVIVTNPGTKQAVANIKPLQRDFEILHLVKLLEKEPKIRWKDSIKKVIGAQFKLETDCIDRA